ncbi:MAG TPA: replication-associated recombination protein A [bacterium]|nr:replication-associated recombination protein A [bacterium]HPO52585.1 replication-associated recombination protein A [bacterium]
MSDQLFEEKNTRKIECEPLAYRLKPQNLEEFVGQKHILGEGKILRKIIHTDNLPNMIFYGPPGCGKTALAQLIASTTKKHFVSLNAITATVSDVRKIIEQAQWNKKQKNQRTILFIDEIAHFNKLQQDALMPEVENGTIILIGATTHNPFFSINKALVSRSTVFEFKKLEIDDIKTIINRALTDKTKGLAEINIEMSEEVKQYIAKYSNGDARVALNILETVSHVADKNDRGRILVNMETVRDITGKRYAAYDREDQHYDTISAFIKSIRGSDPNSALYWLAKMLISGEDPAFIARRLLIAASEDIGNADPMGIVIAASALSAVQHVGMPEAQICLAQATIYLATAPKSNASYLAIKSAMEEIEKEMIQEVPDHLKSTGYSGAKILGHGKGYLYPHDYKNQFVSQKYTEKRVSFYRPTDSGYERRIKMFLQRIEALKKIKRTQETNDEGRNKKTNS